MFCAGWAKGLQVGSGLSGVGGLMLCTVEFDKVKLSAIAAFCAVVAGIGISIYAFVTSATPYVTAREAASQPGTDVHVAGKILHETARLDARTATLEFVLEDDEGTKMPVVYASGKPGNFDSAPKASVLGAYRDGKFVAREIRTQCPSKYESDQASK